MMPSFSFRRNFRSGEALFSAKDGGHNFELFLWSWLPSLEIYNIQKKRSMSSNSYLIFWDPKLFKDIAHVGSFKQFRI